MHMLRSLLYLTTALHVSGVTITHLQEQKTTVTTASGNTDIQPKISIDEISLLWLFCGC